MLAYHQRFKGDHIFINNSTNSTLIVSLEGVKESIYGEIWIK